jgi:hypothetical protein
MAGSIVLSDKATMGERDQPPPREKEITREMLEIAHSHAHGDDEEHGRGWLAILMIVVLVISFAVFKPPANANWIFWSATLGRVAVILWLIVRYARERE